MTDGMGRNRSAPKGRDERPTADPMALRESAAAPPPRQYRPKPPDDVFFDGTRLVGLPGDRYPDGAAHGSGCTHSSTLAAHLALGDDPLDAAREARRVAGEAVRNGLRGLGAGAGPVDVFGIG